MDAEAWTALASGVMALATVVLVIAAWLALGQIQEAKRSRHATTAIDFSRRWDEPEMLETRALLGPYKDPPAFKDVYFALIDRPSKHKGYRRALQMLREANYFEDLALLYQSHAVDEDFIIRSLGYIAVNRWDTRWKDVADEYRSRDIDNFPAWRELVSEIRDDPRLA